MKTILIKTFLIVIVVAALLFAAKYVVNRIVLAEAAIASANKLAEEKELQYKKLELDAAKKDMAQKKYHLDEMTLLLSDYEKLANQAKEKENEYVKTHTQLVAVVDMYVGMRNRLQSVLSDMSARDNRSDTTGSGEESSSADTRRSVDIIKNACAITTSQYNRCKVLLDLNCSVTGCTESVNP